MTWADVAVASAFVVGATASGFACIRVMKHVLEYLREEANDSDPPPA